MRLMTLHSEIAKEEKIEKWKQNFLPDNFSIEGLTDWGFFHSSQAIENKVQENDTDSYILLLAGGGVEKLAETVIVNSQKPVLLWSHAENNSLAASLEIMGTYQNKYMLQMVYGSYQEKRVKEKISTFSRVVSLMRHLKSMKIGLFGSPSDWLLLSCQSNTEPFGMQFKRFETNIITKKMKKIDDKKVLPYQKRFLSGVSSTEIAPSEIITAIKAYLALKSFINTYQIDAFTLSCFDLLKDNYTACLALSYFNDENIPAACEGDIHALVAMIISNFLTGKPAWMANPSSLYPDEKQIQFAHCTIPISLLAKDKPINLKTHMESDLSVAVEGSLQNKEVTVFRLSGDYKRILAFTGNVIGNNECNPHLCRTQSLIQVNFDINRWLQRSAGNHQLIVYGNILPELELFCELNQMQPDIMDES